MRLVVFFGMVSISVALFTAPALPQECEPPSERDPPPRVVGFRLLDAENELMEWDPSVDIDRVPEPADVVQTDLVIVRTQRDPIWICPDPGLDDVGDPAYPRIALGLGTVVPDVVGAGLAEAREILRAQGLEPVDEPGQEDELLVHAQDPLAGETVNLGARVVLRAAPSEDGPSPAALRVAVPSIIGLNPQAARDAVEGAGLTFNEVFQGEGAEAGRVITQEPPAGILVEIGTQVTATVELMPGGLGDTAAGDESTSIWLPILWILIISSGLASLMAGFLKARYRRRSRSDRVSFEARPDAGRVTVVEDVGGGRSFSLSLRSRQGAGRSSLEEDEEVIS